MLRCTSLVIRSLGEKDFIKPSNAGLTDVRGVADSEHFFCYAVVVNTLRHRVDAGEAGAIIIINWFTSTSAAVSAVVVLIEDGI